MFLWSFTKNAEVWRESEIDAIAVRGNILMMKPLPFVKQAYSLLIQEKKRREISSGIPFVLEAITMNAGNQFTENMSQGSFKNKFDYKRLFYGYRKKTRHTKDRCFSCMGFQVITN